jgi:hypothetical protein
VIGSMYGLMGIDPAGPMPNPRGLDVKVLPPAKADGSSTGRLPELTA